MNKFDYIIAGGGAAGLSLAYYLSRSSLKGKKILIIDKDRKNKNDRTWGFWSKKPTAFDEIVSWRFHELEFISKYFQKEIPLANYSYSIIRGIDFYNFIRDQLTGYPGVEFLNAAVTATRDDRDGAIVETVDGNFFADWVFNSIYREGEILKAASSSIYLRQHFKGWIIETDGSFFNPLSFKMFDFRTPQQNQMRFFYVIPHSENKALVEFTIFSEKLMEHHQYDDAIREYISDVLKINSFRIIEEEFGVIPMTNYRFPVTSGKHIINIGSLGGNSKSSSGYTFLRIQKHVRKIVHALEQGKSPIINGNSPARYHFYDTVLLNILKNRGELSEKIFSDMFRNNSIQQIFQFLDEEGGIINDLKMITSLPYLPFLRSTFEVIRYR